MRFALAIAFVAALGCDKREKEWTPTPTSAAAAVMHINASLIPTLPTPRTIPLPSGRPGLVLPINLGPSATFFATQTSIVGTANRYTWRGNLGTHGKVLLSGNGGHVVGTIFDGTEMFRIESKPGGGGVIRSVSRRVGKIDDDPTQKHGPKLPVQKQQGKVRVLAAYTAAARGDAACGEIKTTIDHAIALTNTVAENSNVSPRFELAGDAYMTSYDESNQSFDNVVDAFAADSDMHVRRRDNKADIVVLFVSSKDLTILGISAQTMADYGTAVSVVNCRHVNDYYVVPHEIGHLFGLNDDGDPRAENTLPYAYGSFNDSKVRDQCWRTIMSQAAACKCGCPLIPYWSNPDVDFNTLATGNESTSDNARVIEDSAGAITRFEGPP